MSEAVNYLGLATDAFSELSDFVKDVDDVVQKGEEQANTRRDIILIIHQMSDALQLAVDLISAKLSKSIIEYNGLKIDDELELRGFLERTSFNFSAPALRKLLHDGKVCGELHALSDKFKQPFSRATMSSLGLTEYVKTFFLRSNRMRDAVEGLYQGEIDFIRDIITFMEDLITRVEISSTSFDGEELADLMRNKRLVIQQQMNELKVQANNCISLLA